MRNLSSRDVVVVDENGGVRLTGGDGPDILSFDGQILSADGFGERDLILAFGSDDAALSGGAGDDIVLAGGGADNGLAGQEGADVLLGGAGDDSGLDGGADGDLLLGGFGDDDLLGGPGDDRLFGGFGDDLLDGDLGADDLYGGPGADVFTFEGAEDSNGTDGLDVVRDFDGTEGDLFILPDGVDGDVAIEFVSTFQDVNAPAPFFFFASPGGDARGGVVLQDRGDGVVRAFVDVDGDAGYSPGELVFDIAGSAGGPALDAAAFGLNAAVFTPFTLVVDVIEDQPFDGGDLISETFDGGGLSFREAVGVAGPGDLIAFDPSVFPDGAGGTTLRLTEGSLTLTQNLTIDGDTGGDGVPDVILSGDVAGDDVTEIVSFGDNLTVTDLSATATANLLSDNIRVFDVAAGTTTLNNLVVTGGRAAGPSIADQSGGGVRVAGGAALVLDGSLVIGNEATAFGGGISANGDLTATNSDIAQNYGFNGGGLFAASTSVLSLTDSTIRGNVSQYDGGGLFNGSAGTLLRVVIDGNYAGASGSAAAGGGGVDNNGVLKVIDSTVTNNVAVGQGGGLGNYNGTLTVTDSVIADNETLDASTGFGGGVANFGPGGVLTLDNTQIRNNTAADVGGGVYNDGLATILSSLIEGNEAAISGGGLQNLGAANVTATTISANRSGGVSGGVSNESGGVLTLSNAAILGNYAATSGGGLRNFGDADILNVTFSGNSTGGYGGGLENRADLALTNSTITGNYAASAGGGVYALYLTGMGLPPVQTSLSNSIIAGNVEGSGAAPSDLGRFSGGEVFDLAGPNVISDGSYTTANPNVSGTDPINEPAILNIFDMVVFQSTFDPSTGSPNSPAFDQGALADNGGAVETVKIANSGTAQDAGDGTVAVNLNEATLGFDLTGDGDQNDVILSINDLGVDARGAGFVRDDGGGVDLGALELQAPATGLVVTLAIDDASGGVNDFSGGNLAAETADGGGLTLREAIEVADATAGADTISFDPAVFPDGGPGTTIRLDGAELEINSDITIDGDTGTDDIPDVIITGDKLGDDATGSRFFGSNFVITDAFSNTNTADNSQILNVAAGVATLDAVVLTGGVEAAGGGAVRNSGTLNLNNVMVAGNASGSFGGGVYNLGNLSASNVRFFENTANSGGALSNGGTADIMDALFDQNKGGAGGGGAVNNQGALTISNATLSLNESASDGGAIQNNNTLRLAGVNIQNNSAAVNGGGAHNLPGGQIDVVRTVILSNSAVAGNGGGISNKGDVVLFDVEFFSNTSGANGGGLDNGFGSGVATLVNSTFTENNAVGDGGAIGNATNQLELINTTITGNNAGNRAGGLFSNTDVRFANTIIVGNQSVIFDDDVDFSAGLSTYDGVSVIKIGGDTDASDGVINAATVAAVFDPGAVGLVDPDGAGGAPAFTAGLAAGNGGPAVGGAGSTQILQTVALGAGGVAEDAGVPGVAIPAIDETMLGLDVNGDGDSTDLINSLANVPHDARGPGFVRFGGVGQDIGAFEIQPANPSLVVTNTAATGAGSLADALAAANANPDFDAITFDPSLNGQTIVLGGELLVTESVRIDGDLNDDGTPDITIDGGPGDNRVFKVNTAAPVLFDGVTITGGYAKLANGGGLLVNANGDVTLLNVDVQNNQAGYNMGVGMQFGGDGGGVSVGANATLTLLGGSIANNSAAFSDGGGLDGDFNSTIIGDGVTISGNTSYQTGGGVSTVGVLRLDGAVVSNNRSSRSGGAGISGQPFSTIVLTETHLTGNNTPYSGGAILSSGSLALVGSLVENNSAAAILGGGGGVYATGAATFTNSTIVGNDSTGGPGNFGGGVAIGGAGSASFYNSTVTGNQASTAAGGVGGTATFVNTIVAGNDAPIGPDFSGAGTYSGVNVFSDPAVGGPSDVKTAVLTEIFVMTENFGGTVGGELANNGGPLETVAIANGGVAQNAGDATLLNEGTLGVDLNLDGDTLDDFALGGDARGGGFPRVFDGVVDVGAFEDQTAPPLFSPTSVDDTLDVALLIANAAFDGQTFDALGETTADTVDISGEAGPAIINLTAGTVTVSGETANVVDFEAVIGTAAGDSWTGSAGADTFSDGAGADTIDGGGGSDTLILAADGVTEAAISNVEILDLNNATSAFQLEFFALTFQVDLIGGGFGDQAGVDDLVGNNIERIIGGPDGDTIDFADVDAGWGVQLTIDGRGGNDTIEGGEFGDSLTGGAGADIFVFERDDTSLVSDPDTLEDFESGVDKVDVTAIGTSAVFSAGNYSPADATAALLGGDDVVVFDDAIFVDTDGNDAVDLGDTLILSNGDNFILSDVII